MIDFFNPQPKQTTFTLPPEAKRAVAEKTRELFDRRIAPYAKDLSPANAEAVINFQQLVFTIDYYFEHNAGLNPAVLSSFWAQAEKFLSDLGVEKQMQNVLLQEIKDYADVEGSARTGSKLSDKDIESFYFLKSCDVRMQRHLLRYLTHEPPVSTDAEINRDILEEIEDDIDDLIEDQSTPFNGNRLLEILNSGDMAKLDKYVSFSTNLPNAPRELVEKIRVAIGKLKADFHRER